MLRIVPRAACYFRLEIINSSGSDVSHLAQSEVDLQKKGLHLSTMSTPSPRVLCHEVGLILSKNKVCTSHVSPVIRQSNVAILPEFI